MVDGEEIKRLQELTSKKRIYFFDSGDDAIMFLMKYFLQNNLRKILIPDCGGWFSYRKYPKRLGLEIAETKTDDALVNLDDLKSHLSKDAFVMVNSLGGYFVQEPMRQINLICEQENIVLVNDVSASIGTELAHYGEFCVGSFGNDKPIELGTGGFIGSNIELHVERCGFENEANMAQLRAALENLPQKLDYWNDIREKIIVDMSDFNIIHKDGMGINIVVAYANAQEKENLINYCNKHLLEYVLCPNYIKVNRDAISIEIKRLEYK